MTSKKEQLTSSKIVNLILLLGLVFVVLNVSSAATPNPGHPWTEVGDGLIQFNTPSALRTYTLPDTNATLLTTLPFSQGDILYGTGASTTATLPKDTNATRYLSNTGASNNPAWAQINLTNGVTGILASTSGGTGNASTSFTGMTLPRTYTLPDSNATILTSATPVTLAQGGTGINNTAGLVAGKIFGSITSVATFNIFSATTTFDKPFISTTTAVSLFGNASFLATTTSSNTYGYVVGSDGTNFDKTLDIPNFVNRTMLLIKDAGATTATNLGFPAAPTLTATVSNADDINGPWLNHATSAVSGNTSGVISPSFTVVKPDWNPVFTTYIKTDPTATTTSGYWVGMFSAAPDNNSGGGGSVAAFRYYSSVDATPYWVTYTTAGIQTSNVTTFEVKPNTVYKMSIVLATTSCKFYINDNLVAIHTTNLPTTSTNLGYAIRLTTLAASIRNIKWSRLSITHD